MVRITYEVTREESKGLLRQRKYQVIETVTGRRATKRPRIEIFEGFSSKAKALDFISEIPSVCSGCAHEHHEEGRCGLNHRLTMPEGCECDVDRRAVSR